ncbi:MAG: hypothetical protein P8Y98_12545 [Anaerolineales bacterium]
MDRVLAIAISSSPPEWLAEKQGSCAGMAVKPKPVHDPCDPAREKSNPSALIEELELPSCLH